MVIHELFVGVHVFIQIFTDCISVKGMYVTVSSLCSN